MLDSEGIWAGMTSEKEKEQKQEAKGLKADRDFTTLNCISPKKINTNGICVHLALTNAVTHILIK